MPIVILVETLRFDRCAFLTVFVVSVLNMQFDTGVIRNPGCVGCGDSNLFMDLHLTRSVCHT